jgi:hypothetical protein
MHFVNFWHNFTLTTDKICFNNPLSAFVVSFALLCGKFITTKENEVLTKCHKGDVIN